MFQNAFLAAHRAVRRKPLVAGPQAGRHVRSLFRHERHEAAMDAKKYIVIPQKGKWELPSRSGEACFAAFAIFVPFLSNILRRHR
jgi:hypothetical protein